MDEFLQLIQEIQKDPKYAHRKGILDKLSSPEYKDILGKIGSGMDAVTAGLGIAEGISQKKYAKNALDSLKRPTIPAAQKVDPALSRLISQAEGMASSPERYGALNAYNQQIRDTYNSGLQQARTASGGQAGVYGSNAQALYNQRLRQATNLPAIQDDISQKYLGLAGQLAGQKATADSYAYMNNLDRARTQLSQFNKESEAAASLYSTGAQNMYQGINYGLNALKTPLADLAYGQGEMTGIPEFDNQANAIRESMNTRLGSIYQPGYYQPEIKPLPVEKYKYR